MDQRDFHIVPDMDIVVKCHQCKQVLEPGDLYWMTEDSSWLFCVKCASGKERPEGPPPMLYPPHERVPLHKKRTLWEAADLR